MNSTATVWTMQVGTPSAAALARWHAVLDAAETAQAARFRADKDRDTYIAAHALLRALLENIGGRPAASWQFAQTEKGKPYIATPPELTGLQFSLSHTSGLVACAAADGFAVGIDTESMDRKAAHADLAAAVLTDSELAIVNGTPPSQRQEKFLRLWTLREAYVKATGQGVSYPREDFSFTLDPPCIHFGPGDSQWQFLTWNEGRHIVSLATHCSSPATLRKHMLTEGDLL